ncbi:unnamed protein product [Caenorhabditis brenneri]
MTTPIPKLEIPRSCVWEDTFWESDRFLAYALHSLTSIEIPLHCFGAYLIVFKTPKSMKTAKFSILQLHIVCAVMDLMITSLWAFYLWWPCPAGYPVGLMSKFGVDSTLQAFIVLNVMLAAALSYISLFENRYDVLVIDRAGRSKRRNLYRILYFSLNVIYIQCSLLYVYLSMPDKEDARKDVLWKTPCMPAQLINNPNFMDLNAGTNLIPFIAFFLVIVLVLQGLYFIAYTTYFLFTNVRELSPATRRIQRKFFMAMFLQALIPVYNNLLMIAIGCNGLFTTLVMILVHHPYRKAVCEIMGTRRLNGLNATVQPLRSFIINRHVAVVSG